MRIPPREAEMANFILTDEERKQEIAEEIEFLHETVKIVRSGSEVAECNKPSSQSLEPHLYLVKHWLGQAEELISGLSDLSRIEHAEALVEAAGSRLLVVSVWPSVLRDESRLKALKQPRFPDRDRWFKDQLRRNPSAKSPELWERAPEWIRDEITYDRFRKRVTKARKDLK